MPSSQSSYPTHRVTEVIDLTDSPPSQFIGRPYHLENRTMIDRFELLDGSTNQRRQSEIRREGVSTQSQRQLQRPGRSRPSRTPISNIARSSPSSMIRTSIQFFIWHIPGEKKDKDGVREKKGSKWLEDLGKVYYIFYFL